MRTMAPRFWILMVLALGLVPGCAFVTPASAADFNVSFEFSYTSLNPYGSWLVSAQYGRVWQPYDAGPGWNPYYDGHWVYTDLGWAWDSDYSWGAIPYHYGTWALDARWGWVWVPGTTWAPAWVVFCEEPDYVGWAPVPPEFSIGSDVTLSDVSPRTFVFLPSRYFVTSHIRRHVIPPGRRRGIFEHARIINDFRVENNVIVNRGPALRSVERWTGVNIRAHRIEHVRRVMPLRHFTRSDLHAYRHGESRRGRLRAAEPYPADRPLPRYAHGGNHGRGRGSRVQHAGGRRHGNGRRGGGHRDSHHGRHGGA